MPSKTQKQSLKDVILEILTEVKVMLKSEGISKSLTNLEIILKL